MLLYEFLYTVVYASALTVVVAPLVPPVIVSATVKAPDPVVVIIISLVERLNAIIAVDPLVPPVMVSPSWKLALDATVKYSLKDPPAFDCTTA
jgi:hypothetical protein